MFKQTVYAFTGVATSVITVGVFAIGDVQAATFTVPSTKLDGLIEGTPNSTAVYRVNLSDLGFDLTSIIITDTSPIPAGATGAFSGFDLDAIKLSENLIDDVSLVESLPSLDVFDFVNGANFAPGTQQPPIAPRLIGTSADGTEIDNARATLQNFDRNRWVTLGNNGQVEFILTSPISTRSSLFMYYGEVGDFGETASIQVTVSKDSPKPESVPEPSFILGLLGIVGVASKLKRKQALS